jgi:hypothetical protein
MKKGSPRDYDAETGCFEQLAQKRPALFLMEIIRNWNVLPAAISEK